MRPRRGRSSGLSGASPAGLEMREFVRRATRPAAPNLEHRLPTLLGWFGGHDRALIVVRSLLGKRVSFHRSEGEWPTSDKKSHRSRRSHRCAGRSARPRILADFEGPFVARAVTRKLESEKSLGARQARKAAHMAHLNHVSAKRYPLGNGSSGSTP